VVKPLVVARVLRSLHWKGKHEGGYDACAGKNQGKTKRDFPFHGFYPPLEKHYYFRYKPA